MSKRAVTVILALLILLSPAYSFAADVMEKTLHDTAYGALIGGLVGTAVMALTDHPGDHIVYIPIGAAVGALAGTAYGLGSTAVEQRGGLEEDVVPQEASVVQTVKVYDKRTGTTEVVSIVNILRYGF